MWAEALILPETSYVLHENPTFHETVAGPYKPCGTLRFKPAPLQPLCSEPRMEPFVVPSAVIVLTRGVFWAGSFKFWEYLQQETTKRDFFLQIYRLRAVL